MGTEFLPEGRSRRDFPVENDCEISSSTDQDHRIEKTIDSLVDLLSNGDIEKQREAAEALARLRRGRDRIRAIGATTLLVDRLSSPDAHIREHMMTLLYRLAADEEDRTYRQQRRRAPRDGVYRRTTSSVLHSFLRGGPGQNGPGQKAYDTAAKLLIKLTNIDKLKDSLASSGAIDALMEVLRFKKGLSFQKEAIATLTTLLSGHDEYKARAVRGDLPGILLRFVLYGSPEDFDMDGILELMAVLATHDWGFEELVRIKTPKALTTLVRSGKLAPQREKVATVLRALTEDQKHAAEVLQKLVSQRHHPVGNGNGRIPNVGGQGGKLIDKNISNNSGNNTTYVPFNGTAKLQKSTSKNSRYDVASNGHGTNGKPTQKSPYESTSFSEIIEESADEVHWNGTNTILVVPQELCCPISKQLMKDPVQVSSGETYDREFIQAWLDKGKITCPKSRYLLKSSYLKPNKLVRQMIARWCETNGVEIPFKDQKRKQLQQPQHEYYLEEQHEQQRQHEYHHEEEPEEQQWEEQWEEQQDEEDYKEPSVVLAEAAPRPYPGIQAARDRSFVPNGSTHDPVDRNVERSGSADSLDHGRSNGGSETYNDAINDPDHSVDEGDLPGELDDNRPATDEEIARAQTLALALSSRDASEEDLEAAALELHDLAFGCKSLRDEIVSVGAADPLASLLSAHYSASTQDAGIGALLILSLNNENKERMGDPTSSVVPAVIDLLKHGSEDAREKAASTLFSLSIMDENKVSIGATPDAIPALVDILSGADPLSKRAQKDAATCLLTLSIYPRNKAQAVRAGVVPYLAALLNDRSLLDLVLAMLAVLSSHIEGRAAIEEVRILPKLIHILRSGTDRNIENALTIFMTLIMKNPAHIPETEKFGVFETILELCRTSGPGKLKTKALRLLEFVEKYGNSN